MGTDLPDREHKARLPLQRALVETRAELVEALDVAVGRSPRELRRFLLAVKREVYNARTLQRHREAPEWTQLEEIVGSAAWRYLELESTLAHRRAAFAEKYSRTRDHQRRLLTDILGNAAFARGLALASPAAARAALRMGTEPDKRGRRERRLEISLLRYVSRAALKLSPYSTLTRLALGAITDAPAGPPLKLIGNHWNEKSLLRLKPYLLDQYEAMLLRHPPLRAQLGVTLNSSIVEVSEGRFLFLRPAGWRLDEANGSFGYQPEALVRVGLSGSLLAHLSAWLRTSPGLPYGRLADRLQRDLEAEGLAHTVAADLEGLLRVGFLQFVAPWANHGGRLEVEMLARLRALPADDRLAPFVLLLDRVIQLEDAYACASDPVRIIADIDRLIGDLWRSVAELGGLGPEVTYSQPAASNYYEDVLLTPTQEEDSSPVLLGVPGSAARSALRSLEPVVRLSTLFDRRHDFLHAVAALIARRWPGERDVGLMELFDAVQPLWLEFVGFVLASRQSAHGWSTTFNPLELPVVEELRRLRAETWAGVDSCRVDDDGTEGSRVSIGAMQELLDRVPDRYTASVGACLFLQPADPAGSRWVLNRVKEGTGRFGSRYTALMDSEVGDEYAAHLVARGRLEFGGSEVELLDVRGTQGDTLNVHAAQTPRVLQLPGDEAEQAHGRRLTLRELRVQVDGENPWPTVRDRSGRRYLPVHLGGGHMDYMAPLARFLCAFGPSELTPVFPTPRVRDVDELQVQDRLLIGNVILRRKAWTCPTHDLRDPIETLPEPEAFLAINHRRRAWGIPERVFLTEKVRDPVVEERYQPQYLDFTSPLFVPLLKSILRAAGDRLTLVEMLPTTENLLRDGAGRDWAVELLLDSIALRPLDPPMGSGEAASAAEWLPHSGRHTHQSHRGSNTGGSHGRTKEELSAQQGAGPRSGRTLDG